MYCNLDTNRSTMSDSCGATDLSTLFPFRMGLMMDAARRNGRQPATDIKQDASKYVILMNMPGVTKDRVTITSDDNGLTIRTSEDDKKDEEGLKTVYRERMGGTYERQFRFQEPVDIEKTVARMENGVLELTVPKKVQDSEAKTIHVE
jgi:HSP20 family molecular chaperone IbpA